MGAPGFVHPGKELLEFEGFRLWCARVKNLTADHVPVGADEPDLGVQAEIKHMLIR
jgi:hypothetical protein